MKLYLFDIDKIKLDKLAADLSGIRENIHILNDTADLSSFDLLINATPLGLKTTDPDPAGCQYSFSSPDCL